MEQDQGKCVLGHLIENEIFCMQQKLTDKTKVLDSGGSSQQTFCKQKEKRGCKYILPFYYFFRREFSLTLSFHEEAKL